jgi:hypothetical protein
VSRDSTDNLRHIGTVGDVPNWVCFRGGGMFCSSGTTDCILNGISIGQALALVGK